MRKLGKLGRVLDFLLLADVFLFGVIFVTTYNLRTALLVPILLDVVVVGAATPRRTKILVVGVLVPVGVLLTLVGLPWGWLIAVAGLVLALTLSGGKND